MKNSSIRSKILISIIGITLLTAIAMALVFYGKTTELIEQNYITSLKQSTRLMIDTIDQMMIDVCNINIKASCDAELKEELTLYMQDENEGRLEEISERMRDFSSDDEMISSMYLILPEDKIIVTTLDYPVYRRDVEEAQISEFQEAIRQCTGPILLEDMIHDETVVSFVEEIVDEQGDNIGYICSNIEEISLSYSYFSDPDNADFNQFCMIYKGKTVAAPALSVIGSPFDMDKYEKWIGSYETTGTDKENIYIYCEGSFSKCGIFVSIQRSKVLSELVETRKYIFGMTAFLVLLAFAAAVYISQIVYKPIRQLKLTMKQVSDGELDTRAEVISNDEIGTAAREFNRMLDQIEELIQRLLEEENEKKDAELEALQYQITPHFMYNTLNSIKCYAYVHQQNEIAEKLGDFVELLQACIRKKGAFMTVAEEVQLLENYISLQEFRNGENFHTNYEIEREAQQCLIPRLLLQPLVENAVLHGLDVKCGKNCLDICAWTEKDKLYLSVHDNGRGMTQEQIQKLMGKKEKKTSGLTSIGISNIQERLQLYYGDQAELSYESGKEGTTALIYLPINRSEE